MSRLCILVLAGATLFNNLSARQPVGSHDIAAGEQEVLRGASSRAKIAPSTLDATKIAWLHVPKAGTSFANVLVTWGCSRLPDDAVVDDSYRNNDGMFVPGFLDAHRAECAAGMTLCGGGHTPMGNGNCNDWHVHKGNFVAMFRQPEQRTMSGFKADHHDILDKSLDLLGYAHAIAGCSVRMMNGNMCGDQVKVTQAMVDTSIDRLEHGFAFVGLTDEWALSVCLFHLMHGTQCHKREFMNVRPGAQHSAETYDTSALNGWTDAFDGALYSRAYDIFYANVAKYGASIEKCRKVCPNSKGVFDALN